jgi:VWA domain containing CoxE-like protein/von Willebrand factor type A domain
MTLIFAPEYAWQLWLAALVVAATGASLVAARWPLERRYLGAARTTQIVVTSATAIAAVFLAIALAAPTLVRRSVRSSFHVVVLLDVSDSMARAQGGLGRVRAIASARLRRATASADASATAEVLTFRSDVVTFGRPGPLRRIADRIDEIPESAFAVGPGTNMASGLVRAGDAIERAGGRGAVVLVSDGNETDGDGLAAAAQLAARGTAIHVLPIAAGAPALGILSANLPAYVDAGSETYVRGVLGNAAGVKQAATVELSAHAVSNGRPNGDTLETRRAMEVAGRQWAQFRTPVVFAQPGLQFVDVAVVAQNLGSALLQRRRLFTHVERAPRVLAIGDDRWTAAFPAGAIQAVRKEPSGLGPSESIEDFDAVVIDGVPAGAFAPGALARIAGAVSSRKTGLFLANGPHAGSPLSATILMSYDESPLEPLLPLISEARARQGGPPPRHLVMLMDTSGSMCGGPLTTAQQIAISIVDRYLRPHDLLDLMAFTTSASARLTDEAMTPQGKSRAIDEIRRMTCDGGTDPQEALQQLAARRLKNCGLLFFSDGGFAPLRQLSQYRPDCRMTVFGIRPEPFSPNEPMSALADPIHVDSGFDPQRIKIPYFDEQAKNHFFEPGGYTPLSMKHVLPSGFAMEVPEMPLEGSATTSPKDDVVPVAVRPKLTDPVLAYRESRTANVGELTTAFPTTWFARAEGRAAIRQWIEAVLPSVSNRRYTFQLTEQGNDLEIDIALAPEGNRLPEIERIDASVEMPATPALEVSVRRDEEAPATFRARLTLPQSDRPELPFNATLVLKESGPDALVRPQRIAMLVPPRQPLSGRRVAESFSFGLNEPLLRAIANAGSGSYDAVERMTGDRTFVSGGRIDLWPFAAALGCLGYLAAILARRVDP